MTPILLLIIAIALVVLAMLPFIHRSWTRRRGGVPGEVVGPKEMPTLVDTRPTELREEAAIDVVELIDEIGLPPTFRERLGKARSVVSGYVGSVLSRPAVDEQTFEELEEALIRADVGAPLAAEVIESLRSRCKAEGITEPAEAIAALKSELKAVLAGDRDLTMAPEGQTVWLFVGVNGVGKTTTIGKLGRRLTNQDKTVLMAAGDTFRAAAAEQLATWATRCGSEIVSGAEGADPSSVIFDGVQAGAARGVDVVLADTAGRLHNKANLIDELRKVRRVADREPGYVTETLLVIDATTGQNGLSQAKVFAEAVDVTGMSPVLCSPSSTDPQRAALCLRSNESLTSRSSSWVLAKAQTTSSTLTQTSLSTRCSRWIDRGVADG